MSKALLRAGEAEFNHNDWKIADRVDRLYMYILWPTRFKPSITERELEYLKRLKTTYGLLVDYGSEVKVERFLRHQFRENSGELAYIKQLINDTKRLFGNFLEHNEDFERWALKERYMRVMDHAEADGDFETVRKCLDSIAKLEGLNRPQKVEETVKDLTMPPLIITTDPKALDDKDEAFKEELIQSIEEAEIIDDEA